MILVAVIGSIYAGLATATEAAALGILAALGYAAAEGRLSLKVLSDIFEGTARTTGMIMAIVIGAYFLNVIITTIGPDQQADRTRHRDGAVALRHLDGGRSCSTSCSACSWRRSP